MQTRITLSLKEVRAANWTRHHVVPGTQTDQIAALTESLVGLHSARLTTPFFASRIRLTGFNRRLWTDATQCARSVIKLRCMRRTLHTASHELAPILHQSTLAFRLADVRRQYATLGATDAQIAGMREEVMLEVERGPVSARQIEDRILCRTKRSDRNAQLLLRTALKELWEEGSLCYLNFSDRLGGEVRQYGSLQREFPNLNLNKIDVESAQRQLVAAHVYSYGPVTIKDISWWSGLSSRRILSILNQLRRSITQVVVDGFPHDFFIDSNTLEWIKHNKLSNEPWAEFLAYEDPSLKGYYQSRRRYVSDDFAISLFNKIGEARASIICSGEVIGIWDWKLPKRNIRFLLFRRLSGEEQRLVQAALVKLSNFIEDETGTGIGCVVESCDTSGLTEASE